jgi:hypothetical protein
MEIDISKGCGGKMKKEKNGGKLFRRPKLTLSCSAEGKEGYSGVYRCVVHWKSTDVAVCYLFNAIFFLGSFFIPGD